MEDFSPPIRTDDSLHRHAGLWAERRPLPTGVVRPKKKGDGHHRGEVRLSLLITHHVVPTPEGSAARVQVADHRTGIRASAPTRDEALVGFWVNFYTEGELLEITGHVRDLSAEEQERREYIRAVKEWEYHLQVAKDRHELERKQRREGIPLDLAKKEKYVSATANS